jgi:hypothetical protein
MVCPERFGQNISRGAAENAVREASDYPAAVRYARAAEASVSEDRAPRAGKTGVRAGDPASEKKRARVRVAASSLYALSVLCAKRWKAGTGALDYASTGAFKREF